MRRSLLVTYLCVVSFGLGGLRAVHAQTAATCGWHVLDGSATPPSIEALLGRGSLSPTTQSAVDQMLRWFANCDATSGRESARALQNEIRRTNSTDPVLRALLGIALLRGPEVQIAHAEGLILRPAHQHSNAERDGARLLRQVLKETQWPEVAEELALGAMATLNREAVEDAIRVLRTAVEANADGRIALALGELLLVADQPEAAARIVADQVSSPRAVRVRAAAEMLVGPDPRNGATSYLAGLRDATGSALHRYLDDVRLLLNPAELSELRGLRSGHADRIRRKWEWRAMLAGLDVEDRLIEHNRRLAFALRHFRRESYEGAPLRSYIWIDMPERRQAPLDDRGILYLRHGEPTEELRLTRSGRIAWFYASGPEGSLFELTGGGPGSDYYLVEPHPICGGRHVLTGQRASGYPGMGDHIEWSLDLLRFDKPLAVYYMRCRKESVFGGHDFVQLRTAARARAETAWESESVTPGFARPLHTATNLYVFARDSRPELTAYITFDLDSVAARTVNGGRLYSTAIRFAAGSDSTGEYVRADTILNFITERPLPGATAGAAFTLAVPHGGSAQVRIHAHNVTASDQGQVIATTRRIPTFRGLSMSDIVLAHVRDGTLSRGSARLAPLPGHVAPEGSSFRLYVELYGAQQNDPLRVRILVAPGRAESVLARLEGLIKERAAMSVTFDERAVVDDGVVALDREIGNNLSAGAYSLVVEVHNVRSGETASAETSLIVD